MTSPDLIDPDLTADERYLLERGLAEWNATASATDVLALAMGFRDVDDLLHGDGRELYEALCDGRNLSAADWRRALLATEIAFASVVVGGGWDWRYTSGLSDEQSIALLRAVQRKISRALRGIRPPLDGATPRDNP